MSCALVRPAFAAPPEAVPPPTSERTDEGEQLQPEGAPPTAPETPSAATQPADDEALLSPEALEAAGVVIGEIVVVNGDVFDPEIPEENNTLFRLANTLHIETRPNVIRSQLLFKSGSPFSARLVRESERILRTNNYLFDAKITPVGVRDGKVDMVVRTKDVWTLKPGFSFGRSGGENSTGFSFEESNLFGHGKEVEVSYTDDVDRQTTRLRYFDPHLAGSWNRLRAAYEDNSDGRLRDFSFDRPFFSLESIRAYGIGVTDWDRIDSRYNLGEVYDQYRHIEEDAGLSGGWSTGVDNGWVRRITLGAGYQHDEFESIVTPLPAAQLPESRTLAYPFVDVQWLQDAFEERRNQDQIERTEDVYTGTFVRARVGYAAEKFGSDRDATLLWLSGGTSVEAGRDNKHTIIFTGKGEARLETGDVRNGIFTGEARYYWRTRPRQLFYAALTATVSENLDADQQILLGGDNGLRGYPLRYQDGSSRALLTLEHRIYTKYYLFRLFHVGGAVFFDMGRTWGQGTVSGPTQGLLKDVGIGLRFGSSRASFGNVIHVDLALPLDGDESIDSVQLLVGTKRSF